MVQEFTRLREAVESLAAQTAETRIFSSRSMNRLDDLYARYLIPLQRELIAFGLTEADAQDVAQDTLIATWKRLESIAPKKEWWYLLTAAKNFARRRATRGNAERHGGGRLIPLDEGHHELEANAPSAEQTLIREEETAKFRERFKSVMRDLPTQTQLSIVLRDRGLGTKEIARKVGLTDQAVRTRLSRALEPMRALIRGEEP